MLDAKILTAVLASLAALAAGMNGGAITAKDIRTGTIPSNLNFGSQFNPLQKLTGLLNTKPEPTNKFTARLKVDTLYTDKISSKNAELHVANLTKFKVNTHTIRSDEPIVIYGYTGDIKTGNRTKFSGRASSLLTSGVNITGLMNVDEEVPARYIEIDNTQKISLKFEQVSGKIMPEKGSSLNIAGSQRQLIIDSFAGDIKIYQGNRTVVLDGKVSSLQAGGFSFGG
ncbi:MAG: hypothetical protein ABEJ99_02215 [Candidatus Nanohaloarchaea archaeon]